MKIRTLASVLSIIERRKAEVVNLEKEVKHLKELERVGVLVRIHEAIEFYDITNDELLNPPKAKVKLPTGTDKRGYVVTGAKAGAYYSDGKPDHVWRGRSRVPQWLKDFLDGRPMETAMTADKDGNPVEKVETVKQPMDAKKQRKVYYVGDNKWRGLGFKPGWLEEYMEKKNISSLDDVPHRME